MEGMRNSIPVLISDTTAMAKSYSELKICLDFESQSPNSLSKQIEHLVSDQELWSKLTQNALIFVAKKSSVEKSSRLNKILIQAVESYEHQGHDSDLQIILLQIYQLTEEIAAIYSSKFWRATKSIRWLIRIVGTRLQKIRMGD